MRLDKYISTLTDLSRKDVKAALKYGRISVDGVHGSFILCPKRRVILTAVRRC